MPYLIFTPGLDYNDEYYSIGGDDARVEKNGFKTKEAAVAKVRELLKSDLSHHEFHSFSEDGSDCEEAMALYAGWIGYEPEIKTYSINYGGRERHYTQTVYDWDFRSTSWIDFIVEAEKREVEWVNLVPALYQIVEVNFDD